MRQNKIYVKVLALILMLFVLAGLFAGCQEKHTPVSSFKPLNVMQITEIENAWKYSPMGEFPCPNLSMESCYYGTHDGYIAIFYPGDLCMAQTRIIAGVEISYGYPFYIYLYKDGRFVEIEDAYNGGLVQRETIEAIAEYHVKPHNSSNNPLFDGILLSITELTVIDQHTNEVVLHIDDSDTIKRIRNTFIGWSYESAATEERDIACRYLISFVAPIKTVEIEFTDVSNYCEIAGEPYLLPEVFYEQIFEYLSGSENP